MTPPRSRGRAPWLGWAPVLLGAVLAGCSGAGPAPSAAPGTTTSPSPSAAVTAEAPPKVSGETATPVVDCGLTVLDDGRQVIRYCGEGVATVELPLRTLTLEGAECDVRGAFATVNVGVSHSDQESASGDYVGVVMGGLEEGRASAADHLALELVVRGSTVALHGQEATIDLSGAGLEVMIEARTADDGPVRMTISCPVDD